MRQEDRTEQEDRSLASGGDGTCGMPPTLAGISVKNISMHCSSLSQLLVDPFPHVMAITLPMRGDI